MAKFREAVSAGRKLASDEKQREKEQEDASAKRRAEGIAAGKEWIERVVRPVVESANADLQDEKLQVRYEPKSSAAMASVTLSVWKTDTPRGTDTGRQIAFHVSDNGQIQIYHNGGMGRQLGNTKEVKSGAIEPKWARCPICAAPIPSRA
jgi:hypothetical protein